MTAIPAQIAGCPRFLVCTPPRPDGTLPTSTLVACDLLGVKEIYKIGGAQAIAAMAYGTETIAPVFKVFGAGNPYVTEAKMQVFGQVDIDMPAGPSEIMILADESANPRFVAADLISQAEHGVDSASVLVTTSSTLAEATARAVNELTDLLSTKETIRASLKAYGRILLVETLEQGAALVNDYAPEHLEIITSNDAKWLAGINNVGSVFLGNYSCEAAGDYATGSNHVLPTNGFAKMFSPLSVESFGRKIQVQQLTKTGLAGIRQTIATLATAEGLPAHRIASEIRFEIMMNEKESA